MKPIGTIAVILAAAVGLGGCDSRSVVAPTTRVDDSGVVITRTLPVGTIRAVSAAGAARLIVDQNGPETLDITADQHVLPRLRAEVVGGRLTVGPEPGVELRAQHEIVYRLGARALEEIEATGAVRVESSNLAVERLTVRLAGASSALLSGAVSTLTAEASGASSAGIDGVRSPDVHVRVSGTSHARARSMARLIISASGASVVEYYGDPILSVSISGASVVRRIGP